MTSRRRVVGLALAVAAGLGAAACGNDADPLDESTVRVFGPYLGVDADRFAEVIEGFELTTGIDVAYTGSVDFVSDLRQRAVGNQRPDVAIVPQPGVVDNLVDGSALVPVAADTAEAIRVAYDSTTLATTPWNLRYAVPYRSNVKSLVWFRPDVFSDNGWTVPNTLDELSSLVDEIDASGSMAPWCFSIFAGSATGWPATDWIEDLVLRTAGADIYDQWANGEWSWQTPEIKTAFQEFSELVIVGKRSFGGIRAVLQTEVSHASSPLFADHPGCALYKQASFAENWFPPGTSVGADGDVDFFVLPGERADDTTLVTAGEAAVAFDDRPAVERFMAYLATADSGRTWAREGGFVSQRVDVDLDAFYNDIDAAFAELLRDETTSRFDASDTLPAEIGSGLLWQELTNWMNGSTTLDGVLASMDEALGLDDTD